MLDWEVFSQELRDVLYKLSLLSIKLNILRSVICLKFKLSLKTYEPYHKNHLNLYLISKNITIREHPIDGPLLNEASLEPAPLNKRSQISKVMQSSHFRTYLPLAYNPGTEEILLAQAQSHCALPP